ncbi:F-box domain containing protein [Diplocarpon rosae]|nr:F-box domain containing protein [Diplocarpon rosae]
MAPKRRRSVASTDDPLLLRKRTRADDEHPRPQGSCDRLSVLSDELLIRILHLLPLPNLLRGHLVSRRFYRLSTDSQIWKNLYYDRFVLPRALRIPGIKNVPSREEALVFSSRRSKWLGEEALVNRDDGKRTDWKGRFRLRHNWSRGVCEVREIRLKEERSAGMLVKMADGVVLTVDAEDGVRAWDLKGKGLIAQASLESGGIPTCLAVDEQHTNGILGIAVGFADGGWQTWKLNVQETVFVEGYKHPSSTNGRLSAVAFAHPYLLTITQGQLLSLYSFSNVVLEEEMLDSRSSVCFGKRSEDTPSCESLVQDDVLPHVGGTDLPKPLIVDKASHPRLLASLKSHTSWPPLSLSIRTTPTTLIASIAYTLRTYTSGYTVGLQELHLSLTTGSVIFSRLASAVPQGFTSLLPPSSSTPTPTTSPDRIGARGENSRPTTLSYSHPYILATHPDNTLTLYICTSTASTLTITPGTKLWGHTSSVSSAEITPRGKAVSVSTRGNELRVWELEGGLGSSSSGCNASLRRRARMGVDKSVRVRTSNSTDEAITRGWDTVRDLAIEAYEEDVEASKQWVGFDDELVIVLKESGSLGRKALTVYDFT